MPHIDSDALPGSAGPWRPTAPEREAAWGLWVELASRGAEPERRLRDEMTQLYHLIGATRDLLRRHGPVIACPGHRSATSLGALAVAMINQTLRPVLEHWHPRLLAHEETRPNDTDRLAHERTWTSYEHVGTELDRTWGHLADLRAVLAQAAGVDDIESE